MRPKNNPATEAGQSKNTGSGVRTYTTANINPFERITSSLDGVIHTRDGHARAICPSHASKHRSKSLAIKETSDGGVLLHCFAGCGAADILGALGLELKDLFPADPHYSHPGRPFTKKAAFSPREALELLAFEATLASALIGDVISGKSIPDADWQRFLKARDRIVEVRTEYAHG